MQKSLSILMLSLALIVTMCARARGASLEFHFQRQIQTQDEGGHIQWKPVIEEQRIPAAETAIIICDMWDKHWSRGATERVVAMAPRMNEVIQAARALGITIIHAPSETMAFYKDTPARQRMADAPFVKMPKIKKRIDPALPIEDSDGGSDTGEKPWYKAWTRQHPAIEIDQSKDGISDDGQEVWNFMRQKGINHLLIMGVHTNMCVLGRSFAIKAMVNRGAHVALVRDLTDTMYNPAMPPYVNHDEGTRLVVEYIEKFFCATIVSEEILKQQTTER